MKSNFLLFCKVKHDLSSNMTVLFRQMHKNRMISNFWLMTLAIEIIIRIVNIRKKSNQTDKITESKGYRDFSWFSTWNGMQEYKSSRKYTKKIDLSHDLITFSVFHFCWLFSFSNQPLVNLRSRPKYTTRTWLRRTNLTKTNWYSGKEFDKGKLNQIIATICVNWIFGEWFVKIF